MSYQSTALSGVLPGITALPSIVKEEGGFNWKQRVDEMRYEICRVEMDLGGDKAKEVRRKAGFEEGFDVGIRASTRPRKKYAIFYGNLINYYNALLGEVNSDI